MHIMEEFCPWQWCQVWCIVAQPCLMLGISLMNKVLHANREALPLFSVTGAYLGSGSVRHEGRLWNERGANGC